ncbi:MAG: N-6 DNA methylase [Candidatus Lokiarchaeota archaeon]|nr:N-6 DNA methylase [Candidatus Lokiarchaeota archaeon]
MLARLFSQSSAPLAAFLGEIQAAEEADGDFKKQHSEGMACWREMLEGMYDSSHLTMDFYWRHAFLVLVASVVLGRAGISMDSITIESVRSFVACFPWLASLSRPRLAVEAALEGLDLPRHDVFNKVYPLVVSYSTQHGTGEYYTPVSLARMMVSERFVPGMRAVDPSCGSGTFLVEMVNAIIESGLPPSSKTKAIAAIAGADKNPVAVFMTAINLLLVLRRAGIGGSFPSLYLGDALFLDHPSNLEDLDLVIGNPPWIVLGGIENAAYKERLKQLAIDLGIYVGGKNASNLEVAALFFYKFLEHLKPGRWVFFLLPNSIITGSQHDKARVFAGFDAVHAWRFSRQPFKIHSVCLAGRKASGERQFDYKFPFTLVTVRDNGGEPDFTRGGSEVYEPGSIKGAAKGRAVDSVGRLIPADKRDHILPRGRSPYATLFYKGAQIFPRTMFFVEVARSTISNRGDTVTIAPSRLVQPKKLGRWNFLPYKEGRVERRYIFKIAKSTFLVPFQLVQPLDAFLPCVFDTRARRLELVEDSQLLPGAASHMSVLQAAFSRNLKPGAAHTSLREIINYQNCLVNPRQMAPLKVVYSGGGSIVKGALIEGDVIVDYSMFYCPVASVDEGHYLVAYLNAPSLTESVKLVGSTGFHGSLRNIVKHPLDFPWPIYDPTDPVHAEVARLGEKLAATARSIMVENNSTRIGGEDEEATRMKLQHAIFNDGRVEAALLAIDGLVREVIGASHHGKG